MSLFLLMVNLGLQIADSALTIMAVTAGHPEGNPWLAWLMSAIGLVPALAVAKMGACSGLWVIYRHGGVPAWCAITGIYLFAVLNWTVILFA